MVNKKSLKEGIEKKEALMRVPIGIVSGILLFAWAHLIFVLMIINFFYTLFEGKRLKEIANMSETWNTQVYFFQKYMVFLTNDRPFPFSDLNKNLSEFKE